MFISHSFRLAQGKKRNEIPCFEQFFILFSLVRAFDKLMVDFFNSKLNTQNFFQTC